MEFLRNWIEQIAVAVIIASIFEMILPNGKTKKYIKMILGVFIVFSMISPFVDSKALYNFDVNEVIDNYKKDINTSNVTSNKSIDEKVEEMYIKELEDDISKNIKEQGYNVKVCKIDAKVYSDNDDAGINSINITLLSKNNNYNSKESKDENSGIEEINKVEIGISMNTNNENNEPITEKDIKILKKNLSEHYEIDKKVININY